MPSDDVGSDPTVAAPPSNPSTDDTQIESSTETRAHTASGSMPGYRIGPVIGRGGMGEVVVARDDEIGRDVAVKRLSSADTPVARERFLREARVQARLEHPAIVPVYELGRDTSGQPFFSMKRITGVTLQATLASDEPPPRQRLLRLFTEVCRAIDFAHSRGVVHRDLKPANIMLGDFGEVYVLDWGVARVLGQDDESRDDMADVDSLPGATQAGSLLGTPGYMAPEQIEDAHNVDTRADVYGLGTILFEILAGERLHVRAGSLLSSTLESVRSGPAARRPDRGVPPELDELCIAALSIDRVARPTARALAERIEGYLDGDRDLEQRRRLAETEVDAARASLTSGTPEGRADAMRRATRALALDQGSRTASDLITELMLSMPTEPPPDLREHLETIDTVAQRRQGRVAAAAFSMVFVFFALSAWNGIDDWWMLVGASAYVLVLTMTAALAISRRRLSTAEMTLVTLANSLLGAVISRSFGLLVLSPVVSCITALSLSSYPQNIDRRGLVVCASVVGWLGAVVLEWLGVLAPTWKVTGGAIISTSPMIRFGGTATIALLVVAHVIAIAAFVFFANALARSRRDAQRQVESQAWHLRQLLPAPR